MRLTSLEGCRLKIGSYPPFLYNASGGGGKGKLLPIKKNNIIYLRFSSNTFSIPPLTSKTTKIFNFPLPPGLKIEMSMDKLEGTIDQSTGEVFFIFESKFILHILSIIKFPYLTVKTRLTTGKIKGQLNEVQGITLQKNGETKLVGISTVPQTGNKILDTFLNLPNEALAELNCIIQ